MFDYKKPTVQMLGRWQPWHEGHTELFKRAHAITGQVIIMIRDVFNFNGDAGAGRTAVQDDNPFGIIDIISAIERELVKHGFHNGYEYMILEVPNIVDISYGRSVGYTFTEHDLGEDIHNISATKIRNRLREEGKLK
jgi:nicotinamide mononucleotide adenylyltransferase|tara:strand:+ start:384 stop:794 length:411 start_codon:yes stop_codon:yes gene_type:complete